MIHVEVQGERVPALGFGTWRLRGEACRKAVEHALALGYRHLDTAQMYENEAEVGRALQRAGVPRHEVFLTTKLWYDRLAPAEVRRAVEESLGHLQTDYVDLLLIHWPNRAVPLEETLAAMMVLRQEGKARHIGVSNFTPALFTRAAALAPVFCNQVEYHPYLSQQPLLDLARQHDALLTAYSPLALGKVLADETLREIAARHEKSPAQVTLRWLLQQGQVAAIPKAARAEHRAGNLAVFDFALTEEEMGRIAALARGERFVSPGWAPWAEQPGLVRRLARRLRRLGRG